MSIIFQYCTILPSHTTTDISCNQNVLYCICRALEVDPAALDIITELRFLRGLRMGPNATIGAEDPPRLRQCLALRALDLAPVALHNALSSNQVMRLIR